MDAELDGRSIASPRRVDVVGEVAEMSSWLTGNLVKNSEGKRKATAERLEVESTAWARVGLASLGLGQALTTAFDLQNPALQGVGYQTYLGEVTATEANL